jgi:SPP1 family predicted phage head-tail adaptor
MPTKALIQGPYIGEMDRHIQIQAASSSYSDTGHEVITWNTIRTCWSNIRYGENNNTEDFEAQQQVSITDTFFVVRYFTGLTAKHRIVYNSETYDILNILEIGRKRHLLLQAEKRT